MDKNPESMLASTYPPISQILPFENRLRIFETPQIRFIGKSIKDTLHSNTNPCPAFWSDFTSNGYIGILDELPHVIPGTMAWSCEYIPETNQYTYMICAACPVGTPVPEGFEYREVPASIVAHTAIGVESDVYNGELLEKNLKNDGAWGGEFYPGLLSKETFCWIFSCKRI